MICLSELTKCGFANVHIASPRHVLSAPCYMAAYHDSNGLSLYITTINIIIEISIIIQILKYILNQIYEDNKYFN